MPLPAAHILVGAAAAEVTREPGALPPVPAWTVGAIAALLPDMDIAVGVLLGEGTTLHGTFTHTPVALLALWTLMRVVVGNRWAAVAAAGYGSHLLIDVLERSEGSSVKLAWPLSNATVPSLLPIFPAVPWEKGSGAAAAAQSLLHPDVFPSLVAQSAVGLAFFAGALLFRHLLTTILTTDDKRAT